MAATLYEHPENKMNLTAVTGTNGKTTAATILSEMMGQMNGRCTVEQTETAFEITLLFPKL